MDQQITLQKINQLVEDRNTTYTKLTDSIIDIIKPNVITAIAELLDATLDMIEVIDVETYQDTEVSDELSTMVVACIVEYSSASDVPLVLQHLSPITNENQNEKQRMIRVAIPFSFLHQDKDIIKSMLYRTLIGEIDEIDELEEADLLFTDELLDNLAPVKNTESNVVKLSDYMTGLTKDKLH